MHGHRKVIIWMTFMSYKRLVYMQIPAQRGIWMGAADEVGQWFGGWSSVPPSCPLPGAGRAKELCLWGSAVGLPHTLRFHLLRISVEVSARYQSFLRQLFQVWLFSRGKPS